MMRNVDEDEDEEDEQDNEDNSGGDCHPHHPLPHPLPYCHRHPHAHYRRREMKLKINNSWLLIKNRQLFLQLFIIFLFMGIYILFLIHEHNDLLAIFLSNFLPIKKKTKNYQSLFFIVNQMPT